MILCCGEALIDMLPRETAAGEPCFRPCAGGAVFNTAIALARLEAPAGLFTGLSEDLFGALLARTLSESGVDVSLAVRSARPTTLAFVELVDGHARYAFYDENTAGRMLVPDDVPAVPDRVEALFLGGISLMVEPCAGAYEAMLERHGAGRVVMMDPNIRPGFIADEAAYRARLDRMLARADIVKVSDEDLHWLSGAGEVADLARALMARGPRLVCVTEGARGVRAFAGPDEIFCPARKVTPVDTVGAGDTFNAGLLAGLRERGALDKGVLAAPTRAALEAALDLAVRAAAVTVSRAGANPPRRDELMA